MLFDTERVDFDVSVAATAPTNSSENDARQGMPNLAPTFEFGPNLNFTLARGPQVEAAVARSGARGDDAGVDPKMVGWLASPNLNLDTKINGWNAALLRGPVFGSPQLQRLLLRRGAAVRHAVAARATVAPGGYRRLAS